MKKKVIFVSLFLSLFSGVAAALGVAALMNNYQQDASTLVVNAQPSSDLHFASHTQNASLPDLTVAAQMGVEAVVNVEIHKQVRQRSSSSGSFNPFEFFFGPQSQPQQDNSSEGSMQKVGGGSGVIISSDGYIVTNNHVINEASKITVTLNSGERSEAVLVGTDPSTDIALLKIDAQQPLKYLTFGNSETLQLGEWVLAVGNPLGLNSTVTAGIVSALGRSLGVIPNSQMGIEAFIQTDAAVNPGNSGGALLTTDGSLVGINTLIKSPTGSFTGYSFAVPAQIVQKVVSDIKEYGIVQRALLGVSMQEINADWIENFAEKTGVKETEGVYVAQVSEGGAAQAAGIKTGDVITQIEGTKVKTASQVQQIIAGFRPGDKIKITIKRDSSTKHFTTTLRNKRGGEDLVSSTETDVVRELGAELKEINKNTKSQLEINGGLQVYEINKGGILANVGVKVGFVITAINDIQITTLSDLNKIEEKITSISGIYPNGRMVEYRAM